MRAAAAAVANMETLSHMEATGLTAEQVDEETGWICDEIWDDASQEVKDILWEQTQGVIRRRAARDAAAAQQEPEQEHNADGNEGDVAAGDAAADEAHDGPAAAYEDDAVADYQRQRMLRCLQVMELKVADLQRQLTFLRRQIE